MQGRAADKSFRVPRERRIQGVLSHGDARGLKIGDPAKQDNLC
jgi:hypothetical protein